MPTYVVEIISADHEDGWPQGLLLASTVVVLRITPQTTKGQDLRRCLPPGAEVQEVIVSVEEPTGSTYLKIRLLDTLPMREWGGHPDEIPRPVRGPTPKQAAAYIADRLSHPEKP